MRKLLLIISLLFSITTLSFAQKSNKTPQQKAGNQTQKWTKDLGLSPDQSSKIQPILLQQATQIDAIKAKYPSETDKKVKHNEIKAVHEQTDAALQQIFTPEQYTQYTSIKAQKKAEHKQKKGQH